jgi:UDP-2,3-diacylglucosamine hydrolase
MELLAPESWRCVDFISDLHLQRSEAPTVAAFQQYLHTTCADAVFLLGDIFEVWVGDDVLQQAHSFETECAAALRHASDHKALYLMHGNRDFLVGAGFAQASGCTLLPDPTVLCFGAQRWLLSHGDAWCLDDTAYMQFRAMVRSTAWQSHFLAQPLPERQALARELRTRSEAQKQSGAAYADLDSAACLAVMQSLHTPTLIHGHTHRPAHHTVAAGYSRWVLSDWDLQAQPPRGDVLRLRLDAATGSPQLQRVALTDVATP